MDVKYSELETFILHQHLEELKTKITAFNPSSAFKNSLSKDFAYIEKIFFDLQHKLSFLTERNPLAVIAWNRAFEVTDWNPAATSIFGYTKQEAIGRHAAGLLVSKTAREHVDQVMTALLKQEGGIYSINENLTKSGKIITCKWYNIPLTDLSGNVVGVLSMVEDITANKALEAAFGRSEARFRKLVANVPGMIYQFRLEPGGTWSFPYISDACREIFYIEPEEVIKNAALLVDAVHPEDKNLFLESVAKSAHTLEHWDWEGRMKTSTGELKWIRGISRPELLDDGTVIWDGVLIDISEARKAQLTVEQAKAELEIKVAERTRHLQKEIYEHKKTLKSLQQTQLQLVQNAKMSSLGQLVAGIAHEINNPVSFIYGNLRHAELYTDNLVELLNLYLAHYPQPSVEIQNQVKAIDLDFLLDDLPKLYSSMRIGANRICEIVASLRTFSRLDEAECKQADIHEGINSTLMLLEHRLKAQSNRPPILIIKEYGNLPIVECYPGQLNQVFMNIITNAIDALSEAIENSELGLDKQSSNAYPSENLQCHLPYICIRTQSKSNQIIISISDNGIGIPEEAKHKLFDPFYTTKPVGKGIGMGLSISYKIITEQHGGKLEYISEPGHGTEFIITIPINSRTASKII
ncbi:MAG: PAS domain S-box protein [Calothrix sp. C42_A2020_038]|nr:PAS domain S-box protein [Calothrix sp. C42_A2020_038]